MKFATKIFIYTLISTALIIIGMSFATYKWIENHHVTHNLRYEKQQTTLTALISKEYLLRNDRIELFHLFQSIINVDPYVSYIFAEKKGEVIVHTFKNGVPKGLLSLPTAGDIGTASIIPVENNDGELIYHLRCNVEIPEGTTIHLGISDKVIRSELHQLRNLLEVTGCILLLTIPLGLAFFLSGLVSKPINTLRNGVKRFGSGDLDHRIHLPTGDEIEELCVDINTMAEKLGKLQRDMQEEIKERMNAQNALAKQTELINHILRNVPHSIFWKNRDSIFLGCNNAFAQMAGLRFPDEIIGKTDHDLPWKKKDTEFYLECDKKIIETGIAMYDIEESITHSDGKEKTIITSKVPLKDGDDNVFGILGIFYDITERKKIEEVAKQTQKMEAIGTLAGGIAHDFNNILGSIIGYTELAKDDVPDENPAASYLEQVLKSALRAKDLVRQILTFSRKSQEERHPIQLAEVVREEMKLLRSTLPATIEINQYIEEGLGRVFADVTQMHQVVMNLCTNSAHAMQGNGGRIDVSLSSMQITEKTRDAFHNLSPGPFLQLKISDTGKGIDSRIIHRIFEPFFTTKEKEKGTGMGLAVVHGIIKDHGGDISVESSVGKGSTFTILLPQVVVSDEKKEDRVTPPPRGKEHILFIDDEKMLLNLGVKVLKSLGYSVTPANGSLEALEIFQKSPEKYEVVVTDQTMPHMTGYHLSQRLLDIQPSVPIILCTGYSDTLSQEKIKEVGIRALLYKPVSKEQFALTIRHVLDAENQS